MLGIERKPFKSIIFIDFERSDREVIVAEGMEMEITLGETGEIIVGKVQKIASKALLIKIEDEVGYREYEFVEIESIKNIYDENVEAD